jgi:hypothetical protein
MKLKVKEEFLKYSIGGGKMTKIRLDNMPPELYEKYYNLGYTEFFEVVEYKPLKKKNNDSEDIKIEE